MYWPSLKPAYAFPLTENTNGEENIGISLLNSTQSNPNLVSKFSLLHKHKLSYDSSPEHITDQVQEDGGYQDLTSSLYSSLCPFCFIQVSYYSLSSFLSTQAWSGIIMF